MSHHYRNYYITQKIGKFVWTISWVNKLAKIVVWPFVFLIVCHSYSYASVFHFHITIYRMLAMLRFYYRKFFVVKHSLALFAVFIVFIWGFSRHSMQTVTNKPRQNVCRLSVRACLYCVIVCVCANVYACKLHLNIFHKIKYGAIVFSTFLLPLWFQHCNFTWALYLKNTRMWEYSYRKMKAGGMQRSASTITWAKWKRARLD